MNLILKFKQMESTKTVKQPLFRVVPLPDDTLLISRKKHPRIYHERINKLLNSKEPRAVLQATGASIEKAV